MEWLRRFKRIAALISCLAFFGSCGGQWVILQSVAWAQMWVNYSRTETITHAAVQTFNGKHPCAMCKRISRAKSKEKKIDWEIAFQKLSLTKPEQTDVLLPCPWKEVKFSLNLLPSQSIDKLAPPTPPPQKQTIA